MSDTWYFAVAGQQQGPVSKAELLNRKHSGEIDGETYVFTNGMANWEQLQNVAELNAPMQGAPPPPPASSNSRGMRCHEVDYEIFGEEMQFVEVELDPQETVIAEAGAMMHMEQGIEMETRFGDGSEPDQGFMGKVFSGVKRKLTGETLFMTWFTNKGHGKQRVAFAAPYPGKIIALDMQEVGGEFICQKDSFLAAAKGTKVGVAFNRKIGAGLFGGEGFVMQRLEGDGKAFVHAGGTIIRKTLKPGEVLKVDTGCIVGYTPTVNYDVTMVRGVKSIFFGGEGLFFATLTGPGEVWLQSLPFSRLADRIFASAPSAGGNRQGEGSILGGLGGLLDGDN